MRKTLAALTLLLMTITGFSQATYYREEGKTRIRTSQEYQNLLAIQKIKMSRIDQSLKLIETLVKTEVKGDSTINTFRLDFSSKDFSTSTSSKPEKVYELVGKPFPSFTLKTLSGQTVKLSDYKGLPVVINFWFNGCIPCAKEMPVLNQIEKRYANRVVFLAVTFNSPTETEQFLQKHSFDFIQLVDAKGFIGQIGVISYPKTIMIGRQGVVSQIIESIDYQLDSAQNIVIGNGDDLSKEIEKILR